MGEGKKVSGLKRHMAGSPNQSGFIITGVCAHIERQYPTKCPGKISNILI